MLHVFRQKCLKNALDLLQYLRNNLQFRLRSIQPTTGRHFEKYEETTLK